ncbi:MAG: hypothetical protein OSA38_03525 [Candidatus Poseidoniaceae archaeon]|nr:hypothetical protein [Candidatus Poseidoniaceae archaeon]
MKSSRDRLQQLLDGDLSPEDIADDPALVSLADRLYGIKITPARPVKARDMTDAPVGVITEVAPPTDMLIEVIGDLAPAAPLIDPLALPPLLSAPPSKRHPGVYVAGLGLLVVISNLFGLLSGLLGGNCLEGDLCPTTGSTRINWMDVQNLDTGYGWSLPLQDGGYGLPDIVAVVVLTLALIMLLRRK